MKIETVKLVYFSATHTTKKVVKTIGEQLNADIVEYDITQNQPEKDVHFNSSDLLVVGMPVYAGRIPATVVNALNRFKGNETPAILVCVYGNRDYDDALLEIKDMVEANGFKTVTAAAFVAQHSIFPKLGENRPDEKDIEMIKEFASKSLDKINKIDNINALSELKIKGNNPYRLTKKIPLSPKTNNKCVKCGICARLCPAQAIPVENPKKTDKNKCIACGRCIVVCPENARKFGGLAYSIVNKKYLKAFSGRKNPEIFV